MGLQEWLSKESNILMGSFEGQQQAVMDRFKSGRENASDHSVLEKEILEGLFGQVVDNTKLLLFYHWAFLRIRADESAVDELRELNVQDKNKNLVIQRIVGEIYLEGLDEWLFDDWFSRLKDQKREFFERINSYLVEQFAPKNVDSIWTDFLTEIDDVLCEMLAYGMLHEFVWLRQNKKGVVMVGGGWAW